MKETGSLTDFDEIRLDAFLHEMDESGRKKITAP